MTETSATGRCRPIRRSSGGSGSPTDRCSPGFGSPDPLAGVEVVRAGGTARARIPLGDWLQGQDEATPLTIVYSDSDDGLRQKRLIATSTIERGQELSLGHVRDVDPGHATCVLKGKALRINRPALAIKRGEAIAR